MRECGEGSNRLTLIEVDVSKETMRMFLRMVMLPNLMHELRGGFPFGTLDTRIEGLILCRKFGAPKLERVLSKLFNKTHGDRYDGRWRMFIRTADYDDKLTARLVLKARGDDRPWHFQDMGIISIRVNVTEGLNTIPWGMLQVRIGPRKRLSLCRRGRYPRCG